jgi:hypothetical protein
MPISGYNDRLPDDILVNTGVVYVGNSPMGVSRGGLNFDPAAEMRNVEYDGKLAPVKGLDRKVYVAPVISGRMLQLGPEDIVRYDPGIVNTGPDTTFTPKDAGVFLAAGDYLTNLRLVFERSGGGFAQVRFPVALCVRYAIAGTDRSEGEVDCAFEARRDPAVQTAEGDLPYIIELLDTIS